MSTRTPFAVGDVVFSPIHQQLVRVLTREGDRLTVTRLLLPNEVPLRGALKDANLMTIPEMMDWIQEQPGYVPPSDQPDNRDFAELVRDIISFAKRIVGQV